MKFFELRPRGLSVFGLSSVSHGRHIWIMSPLVSSRFWFQINSFDGMHQFPSKFTEWLWVVKYRSSLNLEIICKFYNRVLANFNPLRPLRQAELGLNKWPSSASPSICPPVTVSCPLYISFSIKVVPDSPAYVQKVTIF